MAQRVASQYRNPPSIHSPFSDPSPFEDAPESVPIVSKSTRSPPTTTTNPPSSSSQITSVNNGNESSPSKSTLASSSSSSPLKNSSLNPGGNIIKSKEVGATSSIVDTSSSNLAITTANTTTPSKSDKKERLSDKDRISPRKGSTSTSQQTPESSSKKKSEVPFDVIDRLDISGLYGGGALHRHDGPYAAASASRNRTGQRAPAPIAAFDPSALAISSATLRIPPRSNSSTGLSPRAAATLAAMDRGSAGGEDERGPYGVRRPLGNRRVSESSVTMGFPSSGADEGGKGQQLIEIYGVRESEAWEDFGTSRYTGDGTGSHASSRESVDGKSRIGTAQSIWDIEATLRAGRPVSQAPPPPVPILTADLNNAYAPKRSKSLAARFRAGRKNPNNPIGDDIDEVVVSASPTATSGSNNRGGGDIYDGREGGKSDFGNNSHGGSLGKNQYASNYELGKNGGGGGRGGGGDIRHSSSASRVYSPLSSSVPASSIRFDTSKPVRLQSYEKSSDENEEDGSGGIRFVDNGFGGGTVLSTSKSLGMEDSQQNKLAGSSQLGRKKSVMQRLFGGKS